MKTLRLTVHGRVQGVFFRDSMRREAHTLGISGWVRNRSDGTVEAVVQGDAVAVDVGAPRPATCACRACRDRAGRRQIHTI